MTPQQKRALITRLKKVRGQQSQRGFARAVGVHQQSINRWEAGPTMPNVPALIALAEREGVSIDWLLLGRGKMKWEG